MDVADEFAAELKALHDGLDRIDYYGFLGLRPACDYVAVRDAFYSRAQRFHPDRYVEAPSDELRGTVYAIYKRMTEAYNVLIDPELRLAYDAARVRGDLRLDDVSRARRLTAEERQVSNPFARIYVRSARAKLERGELVASWIDVELGLSLERAAPLLALHEEIQAAPGAAQMSGGEA